MLDSNALLTKNWLRVSGRNRQDGTGLFLCTQGNYADRYQQVLFIFGVGFNEQKLVKVR
jgi:hypothetical protein